MTIYSYVEKRIEDGGWTGVPRFDALMRLAFPDVVSVTTVPDDIDEDDVVITDNHLSCEVPEEVKTVVVHHGCARVHYERDPRWQNERNAHLVELQEKMFGLDNRTFVAPSRWVSDRFGTAHFIIPHWVDTIFPLPHPAGKPQIIGDWRDFNKGIETWPKLAKRLPQYEFRPLRFSNDVERRRQYGEASLYLCLSLSEGGPFSVCDAEVAGLPIVTTNVGNYLEFDDAEVISWRDRDDVDLVAAAVERKMKQGRVKPSYYSKRTFEDWRRKWEEVLQ